MLKWTFVSLCTSDRSQGLPTNHAYRPILWWWIMWERSTGGHWFRCWTWCIFWISVSIWEKEADSTWTLSKSCKWLTKTIFTMCLIYYFAEDGYDSWGLWWGKTVQARSGVGWFIVVFKCWCTYHSHIIFVFEYCCFVDPEMNTIKWLLAEEVKLRKENVPSKTLVESKFNIQHTPLSLKVYVWLFVFAVVSSWNMHWNTCTYCNWWRDPGAKLSTCHVPNNVDISYSYTTGAIHCYFESQREVGERWLILTSRRGFFSKMPFYCVHLWIYKATVFKQIWCVSDMYTNT